MSDPSELYTYQAGKKVPLRKAPDQFVVRALPQDLPDLGVADAEQVSSHSSRITVPRTDLESAMSRARAIAPTHHAYEVAATGQEFLITDRIIVTFKKPPAPQQLDAFTARYALVLQEAYSDTEFLFQLTQHTGMNPVKLVVKITEEEKKLVETAEHDLNFRMKRYALTLPSDPRYNRQWHLHTHLQNAEFDPRSSARVEAAWQRLDGYGSADVVVGVTDDGCRLDHQDFGSANKFAGWAYFDGSTLVKSIDIDANPDRMYDAGENHGTSCAGVIAADVNGVLTVGAAPGCRLLPVKWQLTANGGLAISVSKMMTALNYLADKIDVLSNSWGGVPQSLWASVVVNRITELAQTGGRRGKGIVFLWAAGNENCPIQHTGTVDIPYTSGWEYDSASQTFVWIGHAGGTSRVFENNLVGIPGVVHVAALASTARRSHYSNYGTGIGLCAPTNNVHTYQRLTVRGLGITTTTGDTMMGVTPRFGGTSSATPLVAGVAALVISANPTLTALQVISVLKRAAAKDLGMDGYARTPPAPTYDPDPSWDVSPVSPFDSGAFTNTQDPDGTWSPWFGHGRVDADAAVATALDGQIDGQPLAATRVSRALNPPRPRTKRDSRGNAVRGRGAKG